ncbi:HAD family hydrolase [Gulosibacter sediminis]|uniref:HAD family hydrolase n=1 Tax=Gulosibacter sediminis TaxID=1729695 RepID=UPI0024A8B6D6|nr:HAD family phosphatase [Gulosibacter sediminis]
MTGAPTLPAAICWDMDGTLIDSEYAWEVCEQELAREAGVTWTSAQAREVFGTPLINTARELVAAGVRGDPEEIAQVLTERVAAHHAEGPDWLPGSRELLRLVAGAGVPCALVSSSYRQLIDPVLAVAPIAFAASVAGDEVSHAKPHPEPYLTAASTLGVEPARCVVVEDSVSGATAGRDAGMRVIAVPSDATDREAFEALGVEVVASLAEIDLELLTR